MKKGLFVGLIGMDVLYYSDEFAKENEKIKTNAFTTSIGGPAANAAITYSTMGGKATLITCIGNSTMGDAVKRELKELYQIDVIDKAENQQTSLNLSSILVNGPNASRTIWSGQQVFDVETDANYDEYLRDALFCLSDCNVPELTVPFLRQAANYNIDIVLDNGNWKEHFPDCLELSHTAIASSSCKPPIGLFVDKAKKHGVQNIAITSGENPVKWYQDSESGEIAVPAVEAIDTLGAGDVFHGAYCYFKYVKGNNFQESLRLAGEVASESVKFKGVKKGVQSYVKQYLG